MKDGNTALQNVLGVLLIFAILLAFGICGGIERGTIPFQDWSEMRVLEFFVPSNRVTKSGGPAPLDGLNELIAAESAGRHIGNALKRRNGKNAEASCLYAMRTSKWKCPERRSVVTLTFYEVSRRRDPDNIFGGAKFILDGITKPRGRKLFGAGAIEDDSQRWIELRFAPIEVDKRKPGCNVRIEVDE